MRRFLEKPDPGCEGVKTCDEKIAQVINAAIEKWQRRNTRLKDMLRLQEEAFIRKREEFFEFIEKSIEDKRDVLEEAGMRQMRFEMEKATEREEGRDGAFKQKKGSTWQ